MRVELLQYVVSQSAPLATPQYPNGYCNLPKEQLVGAQELQNEGFVIAYPGNANSEGAFPVVPTEAGVKAAQTAAAPEPAPAPQSVAHPQGSQHGNIEIETGVPVPATRARGFQPREGGNAVDRYQFNNLPVNGSFHLPPSGDPEKPTHRTFSSIVSQANAKLHPKNFVVREVGADDPKGVGARVWRTEDLTGPRPTRKPRSKAQPEPQATPTQFSQPAAPFGGFPVQPAGAPQGFDPAASGPPAGFGGPGGFPAPGGAPAGFQPPPGGFGSGGPSFGNG